MSSVYENAKLAIVSASGRDANASLWTRTQHLQDHECSSTKSSSQSTQAALEQSLLESTWETRGWTFQEKVLARRMLIFTNSGVFLHCKGSIASRFGEQPTGEVNFATDQDRYSQPGAMVAVPTGNQLKAYCKAIEAYTSRNLTVQSDIENAIKGIHKALGQMMDGKANLFMHGHPTCAFDQFFCWEVREHQPDSRRKGFQSWSWEGWNQEVFFDKEIYTAQGKDARTDQMLRQQWSCLTFGTRMTDTERPAVALSRGPDSIGSPDNDRCWGFPSCIMPNYAGMRCLYILTTGSDLDIATQPLETQGSNCIYNVYSKHGQKKQVGEIALDKQWRDALDESQRPSFFPVFGRKHDDGSWTITKLMLVATVKLEDGYPGYERIQIMACSLLEEEWEETQPTVRSVDLN